MDVHKLSISKEGEGIGFDIFDIINKGGGFRFDQMITFPGRGPRPRPTLIIYVEIWIFKRDIDVFIRLF